MSLGDVSRLRAFARVLDLGSVSAAASVLGYTQSAVSQQLSALEREVGAVLVDRSQRPLRATPAGEALRPQVERVLAALGGAEAAVDDLRGGVQRLRLAAFTSACPRSYRRPCATCGGRTPTWSFKCSSSRPKKPSRAFAPG